VVYLIKCIVCLSKGYLLEGTLLEEILLEEMQGHSYFVYLGGT